MADKTDIHQLLKGYMKIVAKAGGAILLNPQIITEFNNLDKEPENAKAREKIKKLLAADISKSKSNKSVTDELGIINQAIGLSDASGDKLATVLQRIKPDKTKEGAKSTGTGNKIKSQKKSEMIFQKVAEQGDLTLRSLLSDLATNSDLKMKGGTTRRRSLRMTGPSGGLPG